MDNPGAQLAVTVVIPARNAAATLAHQLAALTRQRGAPSFSVVVVDNGSTDMTSEIAKSLGTVAMPVRVIREPQAGVNRARNAGVEAAPHGLVLLCDADDEVSETWVASLVSVLSDDDVWASGVLDYTRLNSSRTRALWGATDRTPLTDPTRFRDTGFGGNCGFHKRMWADLGGFAPDLSGDGDETELFLRAWDSGYRLVWAPDAVVHQRLRPSAAAMMRRRWRQGRSQVRLTLRPEWPREAPGHALTSAARSVAGSVRCVATAPFRGDSAWPWIGAGALNGGRAWQLVRSRTTRTP